MIGAPNPDAACSVTNKVAFGVGLVESTFPVDEAALIAAEYPNVGGCCLSEYQPPQFSKSTTTDAGCISFDCDVESSDEVCGPTHASSEPGSANEATFSFQTRHVIGPGGSAQYFEQKISCCERTAWRECQFDSTGTKVQRIFPCGFVTGYAPNAINEGSGKPTATVTVTLCEGNPIHI